MPTHAHKCTCTHTYTHTCAAQHLLDLFRPVGDVFEGFPVRHVIHERDGLRAPEVRCGDVPEPLLTSCVPNLVPQNHTHQAGETRETSETGVRKDESSNAAIEASLASADHIIIYCNIQAGTGRDGEAGAHTCSLTFLSAIVTCFTLKSMPIVVMKLGENLSSTNRSNRHVFPTPVRPHGTRNWVKKGLFRLGARLPGLHTAVADE